MEKITFGEEILTKGVEWEKVYEKSKSKGYQDKFIDGNEIRANRVGKLGELAFKKFLDSQKIKYIYDDRILDELDEQDFILFENGKECKIDVKTQLNEYIPNEEWNCEVNEKQKNKKVDYYIFVKLSETQKRCFFVGFISYGLFWKIAKRKNAGEEMYGGEKVKGAKWDVKIKELSKPEEFIKSFS
ncbi:MAG: hypothetical protein PHH54_06045 [Candidatus Nanoarchaeia archaeon]|nr:hypothetical protein [Candidatus Nanoarchaeia archaeon]MDD5741516.1 hypothetical protein [Candidatus Nanoarchaeia archaeon]